MLTKNIARYRTKAEDILSELYLKDLKNRNQAMYYQQSAGVIIRINMKNSDNNSTDYSTI